MQGDAANLPFANSSFAAIIANHSLEHFDQLDRCLQEIGRVIEPGGALFVSVPDASTFTDKLYRWLARGGGHVNAFASPHAVANRIQDATGLRLRATTELCSSLSFLNRRNSPRPLPVRLYFLGGGYEWSLFVYGWVSRRLDRLLHLRSSVYGWAFYFGEIREPVDTQVNVNVCLRCGSGCRSDVLERNSYTRRTLGISTFACPDCGAANPFSGT